MRKKDYIKIASVLNQGVDQANDREQLELIGLLTGAFCRIFAADNPRFDEDKFKLAVSDRSAFMKDAIRQVS
jgi:hypothetical protein